MHAMFLLISCQLKWYYGQQTKKLGIQVVRQYLEPEMGVTMRSLILSLVCLLVAITGCSYKVLVKKNPAKHEFKKSYEIGSVQEAKLETAMITIFSGYVLPSYRIASTYQPPTRLPAITPDQEWVAHHTLGDNYVITTAKTFPFDLYFGIEIKPNGELASENPWVQLNNNTRPMQDTWKPVDPQVFAPLEGYTLNEGYFKAEFIYRGLKGNAAHISYREYSNYKGRPAYSVELQHDVNRSDPIVFRSLKILVLEANNERIKFKVLEDGGLPWVPRAGGSQN